MAEKVTLSEAKALGFESTKGITKEGGMYVFDKSLAPDRSGFGSVGVAKPGQVQMTPYFGDVTGAYRLTQEQFGSAYKAGAGTKNSDELLRIMRQNEIKGLVDSGMSVADATAQIDGKAGGAGGASGSARRLHFRRFGRRLFHEECLPRHRKRPVLSRPLEIHG